jgi:hypothetical protein
LGFELRSSWLLCRCLPFQPFHHPLPCWIFLR